MAAPNIVNVATITGKSASLRLGTTSQETLVSNAADQREGVKDQHDPSGKCRWHQRLRCYG